MILQIHDELLFEGPAEEAEEVRQIATEKMGGRSRWIRRWRSRPGSAGLAGREVRPRWFVLATVAAALAMLPAAAQAKRFAGMVSDVPTGWHARISTFQREADLPYGGGRVLHSNRTHAIFWQPAGSGLTFDPGYESLIETFLTDVAADSHRTTNVYSLSGQYTDGSGPAAYDSTYGGDVVDTDPLPANGCAEPPTGPAWTVCLTDAQLQTELEHVVAADGLPTTNRDIYFVITPAGILAAAPTRPRRAVRSAAARPATAATTPRPRIRRSCTR